jgi:hypothetical protein
MLVNGFALYTYPLFDDQLQRLVDKVKAAATADPTGYKNLPATKLLATIQKRIRELIPANPNAPEFRQGDTVGKTTGTGSESSFISAIDSSSASPPKTKSSFTPGSTTTRLSEKRAQRPTPARSSKPCLSQAPGPKASPN